MVSIPFTPVYDLPLRGVELPIPVHLVLGPFSLVDSVFGMEIDPFSMSHALFHFSSIPFPDGLGENQLVRIVCLVGDG